jgi:hypothetical protein
MNSGKKQVIILNSKINFIMLNTYEKNYLIDFHIYIAYFLDRYQRVYRRHRVDRRTYEYRERRRSRSRSRSRPRSRSHSRDRNRRHRYRH